MEGSFRYYAFQPGQVVLIQENWYKIQGVYLGGVDSVNLLGITCMNQKDGYANGERVGSMMVPSDMVESALDSNARLFTPVRRDELE